MPVWRADGPKGRAVAIGLLDQRTVALELPLRDLHYEHEETVSFRQKCR